MDILKGLNDKIFNNTSLSDVLSEIYSNANSTGKDIKELIESLTPMVKSPSEAVMLVPLISNYLNIRVKNDENLIKMANIIQRHVGITQKGSGDNMLLSDQEMDAIYILAKDVENSKKSLLLENVS